MWNMLMTPPPPDFLALACLINFILKGNKYSVRITSSKTTVKTLLISTTVYVLLRESQYFLCQMIYFTSASNRCMSLFNFSLAVYCWPSSLRSSSNTWFKSLVCFAIEASHRAILARTSCNIVTWWTSSLFTALLVPTTAKSRPLISVSRACNKWKFTKIYVELFACCIILIAICCMLIFFLHNNHSGILTVIFF